MAMVPGTGPPAAHRGKAMCRPGPAQSRACVRHSSRWSRAGESVVPRRGLAGLQGCRPSPGHLVLRDATLGSTRAETLRGILGPNGAPRKPRGSGGSPRVQAQEGQEADVRGRRAICSGLRPGSAPRVLTDANGRLRHIRYERCPPCPWEPPRQRHTGRWGNNGTRKCDGGAGASNPNGDAGPRAPGRRIREENTGT